MPKFQPFDKPYSDFPLSYDRHLGYFYKKILGKRVRFGPRGDGSQWQEALAQYNQEKDALYAGQNPADLRGPEGYTIADMCNDFLGFKRGKVADGENRNRTYEDAEATCDKIVEHLNKRRLVSSLTPKDFDRFREKLNAKENGKPASPGYIKSQIGKLKAPFHHAYRYGMIDRPVRFGDRFKKPKSSTLKAARNAKGSRLIPVLVLASILAECDVQFRAMVLLGLNGGFAPADLGNLKLDELELPKGRKTAGGWISQGRSKNAVFRRVPLWPETVKALRAWMKIRKPKNDEVAELVFFTKYGKSWYRDAKVSPVSAKFGKIKSRDKFKFYDLRRSFKTIGRRAGDNLVVEYIMGHTEDERDMDALYNQGFSDEELLEVVNGVRKHYLKALTK